MKIVIDVKKKQYISVMNTLNRPIGQRLPYGLSDVFKNATILPDNPTNGDMIMALFPKVYVQKILDNNDEVIGFETYLDGGSQCFMADWWNAPYEKEVIK